MSEIIIKEMTNEDIDILMAKHLLLASIANFESVDAYEEFKHFASMGLIKFGGSFTASLGETLAHADAINASKIIRYFRSECDHYAELYKKYLAKEKEEK